MADERTERYETFVTWYLRFNGYFTVPNFVIHAGDDPTRISGDVIGPRTEVDTIAVRLPFSRESSGTLFPCDPKLVDPGSEGRFDVIFAEVKSGRSTVPNKIWKNGQTSHIEYLLRFVGWHKEDAAIAAAAKTIARNYILEEANLRVRYIVFAENVNSAWKKKAVQYIEFDHCICFLAEERGQCWATAGIGRRSMHDQWNPLIKRIFEVANDASIDPTQRRRNIKALLENGVTGGIESSGMGYIITRKRGADLSPEEIKSCDAVIDKGGAIVNIDRVNLGESPWVVILYHDGEIVGVGAIKQGRTDYAARIAERSGVKFDQDMHELGYLSILENHREHGYGGKLVDQLLAVFPEPLWATTSDDRMKKCLGHRGFSRQGSEWHSKAGDEQLSLWIRPTSSV